LIGLERECEVVRAGLRECVDSGTAKGLPLLRQLGVHGKTGTAEVSDERHNNAWFAGYLPQATTAGVQLCFCAVVYRVPHGVHGAEAAAQMIEDLLRAMLATPGLASQYVLPEGGR
jgi:cell division protein FtsI/penicillin-binding protein 2